MTASKDDDPDTGLRPGEAEALARLYRRGAPRSPAALDEAVLARAAEALETVRRRQQRRLRYFSLAASLTLVTGLVWQLREESVPRAPSSASTVAKSASAQQQPVASAEIPPSLAVPAQAPTPQALLRKSLGNETKQERRETDTASQSARASAPEAEKQAPDSVVADQAPQRRSNFAAPPAIAGSIAESTPASPKSKTALPAARPEVAPASARKDEPAPAAALAASNGEARRLLQAIRELPPEARFQDIASQEALGPAAFAERMAATEDEAALLKAASNWRLTRADGTTIAADQWLRSLPASH